MKKIFASLLCLLAIISLISCNDTNTENGSEKKESELINSDITDGSDISNNQSDPSQVASEYSSVLSLYTKVINACADYQDAKDNKALYEQFDITDKDEQRLFDKLLASTYLFYGGRTKEDSHSPHYKLSCGYATKDLNKDGKDELILMNDNYNVIALFSLENGQPVLLGSYIPRGCCTIDADGTLHIYSNDGAADFSHMIYKLSKSGTGLEEITRFGASGYDWTDSGTCYVKYYKYVGNSEIDISEDEYEALTEQYGEQLGYDRSALATRQYAGLEYVNLFKKSDIAMEMYNAAINEKIYVIDDLEKKELSNCRFPYSLRTLKESETLKKTVLDMDGDGTNEIVISNGSDHIVLRYESGKVFIFDFTFRSLYHLKTDGSFAWNAEAGTIYGESKLTFTDGKVQTKELWRIVNDGEPNAEYYIGTKKVTHEEILNYLEDLPKTLAEFQPLEASWVREISLDDALKIASEHWNISDGDVDEETGYRFALLPKESGNENYLIALSWLVEYTHFSTLDMIEIDANTGEIVKPKIEGKG